MSYPDNVFSIACPAFVRIIVKNVTFNLIIEKTRRNQRFLAMLRQNGEGGIITK